MALLALSHTIVEHRIYLAMRSATLDGAPTTLGVRRLMDLTGLSSYGSVRRGCAGLLRKLSVESITDRVGPRGAPTYRVFGPEEIFSRREAAGIEPYPRAMQGHETDGVIDLVIEKVVGRGDISRTETLVALHCAEGLSNTEIGGRLGISEKTVKYHLRHVFVKYGIRRRSELLGRLLSDESDKARVRARGMG